MTRNSRTILTALAIILARISDTATTLHFNFPNSANALYQNSSLGDEGNPILHVTGNGARTLVLVNILAVFVLLFLPLWFYWRYPVRRTHELPHNLQEFISLQFFKRIMSKKEFSHAVRFKFPKDWLQVFRLFAFMACWAVVGSSLMAAFNWWAIVGWNWTAYESFRDRLFLWNYPVLEPLVALISAFVAAGVFFKTEFADYKRSTPANDAANSPIPPD